jgi:large subunit ribosomal protein L35
MPKQKTHKGLQKRFKVTASGKVKCRSAFRGHLLSHKTGKRKRQNRADTVLIGWETVRIRDGLRPAS